ncbi:hypothetical protein FA15DRAFT_662902 [Coprinopsis marcescibilis]|uniref:Uncharacterized protein n=1 Tax=Coprinopsis marcescibilis TaxID=230819 RepID=A0A5C3LDJ3_COPMA|nr:hypothetical protein FA15DRAFT_662902 [Coprinopsis marcescibilis]
MAFFRQHSTAAEPHSTNNALDVHGRLMNAQVPSQLDRKPSKKSGSGFSLWSRKSLKRSNTADSISPTPPPQLSPSDAQSGRNEFGLSGHDTPHSTFQRQLSFQDLASMSEFMADELVSWDPDAPLPPRVTYKIHNPLGPRWYKNHHLIPPQQTKPNVRPPTFFSPSFPPISSAPDHIIDSEESIRRASHSPAPTPASSQTRVGEVGIKQRSRKTSQTAPDTVDLLDVTDPWGTNWHHESPYDIGSTGANSDPDKRPRRASMTAAQNRHTSVTPSPLSQSTSAVHLPTLAQPSFPPVAHTISHNIQLPRKLSKKKTPALDSVFQLPTAADHQKSASAPPTPVERIQLSESPPPESASLPKRMSVAPPVNPGYSYPAPPLQFTPKKEKRTSVLGRIAKKFSLLVKPAPDEPEHREYSWLHVNPDEARISMRQSMHPPSRQSSPEKPETGPTKRVPPPSITQPEIFATPEKDPIKNSRRESSVSIETPFVIGKLTVANPDSPESDKEVPVRQPSPSPQPKQLQIENSPAVLSTKDFDDTPPSPSRPPSISAFLEHNTWAAYEKPLPIPVPSAANTPFISDKDISPPESDIDVKENKGKAPARSKTVSSTATRETIKPSKRDIPQAPKTEQELEKLPTPPAPQNLVPEKLDAKSTVSSSSGSAPTVIEKDKLPPMVIEKDKVASTLIPPPPSPSLPPIPATTPLVDAISLARSPSRQSNVSRLSKALDLTSLAKQKSESTQFLTPVDLSPEEMTTQDRINSYLYTDSPYSASSVLANPPTPYNPRLSIPLSPEPEPALPPPPPPKPPKDKHASGDASSPTQATRQTETFKLVRSLSGNVYASADTIPGAGQQWELVESSDQKPRTRSSTLKKDRERSGSKRDSRGEGSKQPKADDSPVVDGSEKKRSRSRHSKQPSLPQEVSTVPMPKVSSSRHSPSHYHEEPRQYTEPYEAAKYRDDYRRKERHRSDDEYRSSEDGRRRDRERDERARLEEERRYDEERRERRRQREKEKERERDMRERERLERELEQQEAERERQRLEWERLENERLEREQEKQRLEQERLELERERERLELEKEKERERRREEERERRKAEERRLKEDERRREEERRKEDERQRRKEEDRERRREEERRQREEQERRLRQESERKQQEELERRQREELERRQREELERRQREKQKRRESEERRAAEEARAQRKREERKEESRKLRRKSDARRSDVPRVESYISYSQQPIQTSSSSSSSDSRPVERRPSLSASARPNSELPSAADLNALRAKEAWEMERLWKARSMYGAEWNNGAIAGQSMSSFNDDPALHAAMHGSSHTAFMLQTPFQVPGSSIYHSMPNRPPPVVYGDYGSPGSIPSLPDYDNYDRRRSHYQQDTPYVGISPPTKTLLTGPSAPIPRAGKGRLNNPLPEPPRESAYQPAPLPSLPANGRSNDPWSKYASVTTAH